MRQAKVIAFTGMLALLISGCAGEGGDEQAASPTPSVAPVATPQAPASPAPAKTQPFSAKKPPLVAQKPRAGTAAPALIQSTNPDERARQVQQGRQDPFALLPLPPVPVVSPNANTPTAAPRPVPQVRTLPGASPVASRPNTTTPGATRRSPATTGGAGRPGGTTATGARPGATTTAGARPGATPIRPGTLPRSIPPTIAALPPLPQPALAQAVEVSGVVQVGEQAQAIIKAPNENTSRYVSVGQRLANGQVLVKRIEMNQGSDPIVIFEQYGIEVAKRVGEKVQPATGTPTAAIFNAPWLTNSSAAIS